MPARIDLLVETFKTWKAGTASALLLPLQGEKVGMRGRLHKP
jgi:hypothetical protein